MLYCNPFFLRLLIILSSFGDNLRGNHHFILFSKPYHRTDSKFVPGTPAVAPIPIIAGVGSLAWLCVRLKSTVYRDTFDVTYRF